MVDVLGPHHHAAFLAYRVRLAHAQQVRHATDEDLDHVETLLAELRALPQLRERKRGYFSRGSRAFVHFHEDVGDFFVDVRLDDKFERMKVTTGDEQAEFLNRVRMALGP